MLRRLYQLNELKKNFYLSASRRQFNIYSRVESYSFSSQTCLLFQRKIVFILLDSLSSLQSIFNLKYDHPVLVQILDLYTEMTRDGREIVFIWVPGHVGIRGNSAADSAAKDALDGDISVELIPFSDLKPRTAVGGGDGGGAGGGVDVDVTAVAASAGGGVAVPAVGEIEGVCGGAGNVVADVTAVAGRAGGGGVKADVTAVAGRAGGGGVDVDVTTVAG